MRNAETIFTWVVTDLVRHAETDMVFCLEWRLEVAKGPHFVSTFGSVGLVPSDDPIPFIDLTEELVQEWLLHALGDEQVQGLKTALINQIENKSSPVALTGKPW